MAESFTQNCPGCGAKLTYAASQATLRCGYCGTEVAIDKPETVLPRALESDHIVPAAFSSTDLKRFTLERMASGTHTPDDIIDKSEVIETTIFYVPLHYFSGSYEADWTASFGYDRQEAYTAYRTVDGQREAYTAYRTVTDWHPASGSDRGSFDVCVYGGSDRNAHLVTVAEAAIDETATEMNAQVISGFDVTEFACTADEAYDWRGRGKVENIVERGVRSHAQGDHQRNWRWTYSINRTDQTALVPVARSTFTYEGSRYTTWFNGINQQHQVGDALPVDRTRKRAIALGFIPLWIALALWLIGVVALSSSPLIGIALVVATVVFGFVRRGVIVGHSKTVRQDSLLRHTAEQSTNNDLTPAQLARLEQTYQKRAVPALARIDKDRVVLPLISVATALVILIASFATSTRLPLFSPETWTNLAGPGSEADAGPQSGGDTSAKNPSAGQTSGTDATSVEPQHIGPDNMTATEIRDALVRDGFCNVVPAESSATPDQYAACYLFENPNDSSTCMYNVAIIQDRFGDGAVSSNHAGTAANRDPLAPVSYADGFWEISIYGLWNDSVGNSLIDSLNVYLNSSPVVVSELDSFENCAVGPNI